MTTCKMFVLFLVSLVQFHSEYLSEIAWFFSSSVTRELYHISFITICLFWRDLQDRNSIKTKLFLTQMCCTVFENVVLDRNCNLLSYFKSYQYEALCYGTQECSHSLKYLEAIPFTPKIIVSLSWMVSFFFPFCRVVKLIKQMDNQTKIWSGKLVRGLFC